MMVEQKKTVREKQGSREDQNKVQKKRRLASRQNKKVVKKTSKFLFQKLKMSSSQLPASYIHFAVHTPLLGHVFIIRYQWIHRKIPFSTPR